RGRAGLAVAGEAVHLDEMHAAEVPRVGVAGGVEVADRHRRVRAFVARVDPRPILRAIVVGHGVAATGGVDVVVAEAEVGGIVDALAAVALLVVMAELGDLGGRGAPAGEIADEDDAGRRRDLAADKAGGGAAGAGRPRTVRGHAGDGAG